MRNPGRSDIPSGNWSFPAGPAGSWSGYLTSDANDWAIETLHNPRYPLELLLRAIAVGLETMKIVKALPPLDLPEDVRGE